VPLEHRIDDEQLLVITGDSLPAVDAARESIAALAADDRVSGVRAALILVSPDSPAPSGTDVLLMSGLLSSLMHIVDGPVAIVVTGARHEFVASMIALSADRPHRVEYFTSEPAARAWLRTEVSG
jgi:hypothetical protein